MTPTPKTKKFDHIDNPAMLLAIYDDDIHEEQCKLYPWQINHHKDFAAPFNHDTIHRFSIRANNGSGKSRYILAPDIIWLATQYDDALCVGTSSSAEQMDTQTERYLRKLAAAMNAAHKSDPIHTVNPQWKNELWDIKQRSLTFKPTGSVVDLFVTDRDTRVEGRHPLKRGAPFLFAKDEAKSLPDFLYEVSDNRFTGMTHNLEVSSTGDMKGGFYRNQTDADSPYKCYVVTWRDTGHIRQAEHDEACRKYGKDSPIVRSTFYSEFTSVDGSTVLRLDTIRDCLKFFQTNKPEIFSEIRAGLDLAAGSAENVLSIWHGYKMLGQETFVQKDTTETRKELVSLFRKWNLKPENIYADDGGVGRGILDQLKEVGWPTVRILNQWQAFDKTRYKTRGTEHWFNLKRFVEERKISFLDDPKLISQLSNRYVKRTDNDKIVLESKQEARANGRPSPDRADAMVLAFAPLVFSETLAVERAPEQPATGLSVDAFKDKFRSLQRDGKLRITPEQPELSGDAEFSMSNRIAKHLRERESYGTRVWR